VRRVESRRKDTAKYLFALEDGNSVETVLMKYDEHLGPGRRTLCVSTQVGCRMGCSFCASAAGGFRRDLLAWEIVDQVLQVQKEIDPLAERVANVVLMGMGEPLANYDNSLKALRLMSHGDGLAIGWRHLAISTCGLVSGIRKLAGEHLPIRLAVSLHSARDDVRSRIMPINRKYPLRALMEACRAYQQETERRITFEYALMRDLNDSLEDARLLGDLLKDMHALVNLIPLNEVQGIPFHRSRKDRVARFAQILETYGLKVTIRRERGTDIAAACGQLRLHSLQGGA
jgi:23S rRNA (adenine2503-C2)-methyltransferase